MGQIIDMTKLFEEERKLNKMLPKVCHEETQVIYVDFKKKKVVKTVSYKKDEVVVECEEAV